MDKQVILAQLVAIRSTVEALIILIQAEEEENTCTHPEDSRIDMSTMGHPRWQCGVCDYIFDPEVK